MVICTGSWEIGWSDGDWVEGSIWRGDKVVWVERCVFVEVGCGKRSKLLFWWGFSECWDLLLEEFAESGLYELQLSIDEVIGRVDKW